MKNLFLRYVIFGILGGLFGLFLSPYSGFIDNIAFSYSPLTSEIFLNKASITTTETSTIISAPSSSLTYFLTDFYLSNQGSPNPNSLILYCGNNQIYKFSLQEKGGAVINLNQTTPVLCNYDIFGGLTALGNYDITITGFLTSVNNFNKETETITTSTISFKNPTQNLVFDLLFVFLFLIIIWLIMKMFK